MYQKYTINFFCYTDVPDVEQSLFFLFLKGQYTVKKLFDITSPARMSLTKVSLGGNNDVIYKLFPLRESLVSDIPAGDGNIEKLF